VLTLGIDCQADRVEVAGGRLGPRLPPLRRRLRRDPRPHLEADLPAAARRAAEADLAERVRQPHRLDRAAIDGNAWTEDVWDWAKRHPRSKLIMVRGRGEDSRAAHRAGQEGAQRAHRQAAEMGRAGSTISAPRC
jgi:hypothetical protein